MSCWSGRSDAWLPAHGGSYLRAGFAVALGTAWLGERFTWSALTGMTLILAGVIAITMPLPAQQRVLEQ
ncbi:hypothetical protein [Bradyrhizobium sp. WSM2254]|uniref:hypothetical protein n=1 Tax=Bradyrhizobium sp. WSM2254 TaxID=1188263 RepID=UPI000A0352B5|nr:hypothetical protein [Bradyrhizobium sp. WSM2254]